MPDLDFATRILKIILFDLILSGDNAVVIGMAARRLPPASRRRAVVLGGAGAVGLRVVFTGIAALILDPDRGIPVLLSVGGALLLWIAYKLLKPHAEHANVSEADTLMDAVKTIVLADVVMSLDNVLAVGAAAHGDLWLLLFGLALSVPILLVGSNYVAKLLGRFPLLVYIGALILIWTAVEMIFEDKLVHDAWEIPLAAEIVFTIGVAAAIILLARRAVSRQAVAVGAQGRVLGTED